MRVGSLFAGIGGFDLGFERAGMQTAWQVEQNAYCRAVLAQHFPGAQRFEDVRDVGAGELEPVDVICGGVPCQPISLAGKGLGEDDERWLWPDTTRIIGELRPRYAVLENPAAFIGRGLLGVLGELAAIGYDAEWSVVSAANVGAPHLRERVWIVAYPDQERRDGRTAEGIAGGEPGSEEPQRPPVSGGVRGDLQDPDECALQPWRVGGRAAQTGGAEWWAIEPPVGRVAHGIPNRLDRLASLGNALVPQIAQWIGERIVNYELTAQHDTGGNH